MTTPNEHAYTLRKIGDRWAVVCNGKQIATGASELNAIAKARALAEVCCVHIGWPEPPRGRWRHESPRHNN